MYKTVHIGLDVGSTTVKTAVLDQDKNIIYSKYKRHFAEIKETVIELLEKICENFKDTKITIAITGSGGLGISQWVEVPFVQEVIACSKAVKILIPDTDVAVELGGEDAKITYFEGGNIDQRMNGTCAGGTRAFYSGAGYRFVVLVVLTSVTILYVMRYASRVRRDPSKSLVRETDARWREEFAEEDEAAHTRATTREILAGVSAVLMFAWMIWGVLAWKWEMVHMGGILIEIGRASCRERV